jgi:hypothetical protein
MLDALGSGTAGNFKEGTSTGIRLPAPMNVDNYDIT